MTFIDQNGEHKSVQGKVGDNVMYLAHRHNVEIEGTVMLEMLYLIINIYSSET